MRLPNNPRVLAATTNKGHKMITFLVDFPTVLLAELRTHRILTQGSLYEHMELDDFNMSANSARAIPATKYLQKILDNPFIPVWTAKQAGMSGKLLDPQVPTQMWLEFLKGCKSEMTIESEKDKWFTVDYDKIGILEMHQFLINQQVHKQNANRLLAPFAYTTCVLSGTEWDNFFELRCPKYQSDCKIFKSRKEALKSMSSSSLQLVEELGEQHWQDINHSSAQPEFQIIAEMLYDLYQEANWQENEYHIPFENNIHSMTAVNSKHGYSLEDYYIAELGWSPRKYYSEIVMRVSASMCAKLSYNTQDNEDTLEKHLERAQMLIDSKHWEPFSHQAVAMTDDEYDCFAKIEPYNEKNKDKYTNLRTITFDSGRVLEQGMYYGWCQNIRGFKSQRYILENE